MSHCLHVMVNNACNAYYRQENFKHMVFTLFRLKLDVLSSEIVNRRVIAHVLRVKKVQGLVNLII